MITARGSKLWNKWTAILGPLGIAAWAWFVGDAGGSRGAVASGDVSAMHLYVHIPFCRSRCAYCDFASETAGPHMRAGRMQEYVAALRSGAAMSAAAPPPGRRAGASRPSTWAEVRPLSCPVSCSCPW